VGLGDPERLKQLDQAVFDRPRWRRIHAPSLSSDKIPSAALTRPTRRSKLKLESETAKALGLHRAAIKGSPAPTKVISKIAERPPKGQEEPFRMRS
jgi:hypothetical protein